MRLTAPTDALRTAVKACQAAVNTKPSQPVLAGVHLSTADGGDPLRMRTFDYETEVLAQANARVDEPGEALVSWRLLSSILAVATGPTVGMELDSGRMVVTAGKATWRMPLMRHEDYPSATTVPTPLGVVGAEDFRAAVDTAVAAAKDTPTVDPALHVVHLGFGATLDVVGTDGFRLHSTRLEWARTREPQTPFVLVPAARVAMILKGLSGDQVTLGADGTRLSFSDGTTAVTTSLVSAERGWVKWGDYFAAMSADPKLTYTFDRDDLLGAVKQAVPVAELLETKARHVVLTVQPGECVVTAESSEDGESTIPIPVAYEGEPFYITANAQYLVDAVNGVNAGTVQFIQDTPKKPMGLGWPKEPPTHILMGIVTKSGWVG